VVPYSQRGLYKMSIVKIKYNKARPIRKEEDGKLVILNSDKKIDRLKDLSTVKVKWFIKKDNEFPIYDAKSKLSKFV